jgi:hypothetical protein
MSEYDEIQTALKTIQGNMNTAENTTRNILQAENQRLIDKQTEIRNAKFGQNRIIDLNRDQMKRTTAYTKVGILTVISLGIVLVFRLLGDVIPDSVMTLIYVILLSVCLFYGIYVYTDVNGREKTNYDRYDIPPPVINLSDEEKAKQLAAAIKAGDLLAANDNKVCSGQACCDYNQAYDSSPTVNKCVKCSGGLGGYYNGSACAVCPDSKDYDVEAKACKT